MNKLTLLIFSILFSLSSSAQTDSTSRNRSTLGFYGMLGRSQAMEVSNTGLQILDAHSPRYREIGLTYQRPFNERSMIEANLGLGFTNAYITGNYISTALDRESSRVDVQYTDPNSIKILSVLYGYDILRKKPAIILKFGLALIRYSNYISEIRDLRHANGMNDKDDYYFRITLTQPRNIFRVSPQVGVEVPFKIARRHFSAGITARYTPQPIAEGSYEFFDAGAPSHGTLKQRNNIVAFQVKWLFRRDPRQK